MGEEGTNDDKTVVAVEKGYIEELKSKAERLEHDVSNLKEMNERLRNEESSYEADYMDLREELQDERDRNDFGNMSGIEIAERIIMSRNGVVNPTNQKVVNLTMREVARYLENYADIHDAIDHALEE